MDSHGRPAVWRSSARHPGHRAGCWFIPLLGGTPGRGRATVPTHSPAAGTRAGPRLDCHDELPRVFLPALLVDGLRPLLGGAAAPRRGREWFWEEPPAPRTPAGSQRSPRARGRLSATENCAAVHTGVQMSVRVPAFRAPCVHTGLLGHVLILVRFRTAF